MFTVRMHLLSQSAHIYAWLWSGQLVSMCHTGCLTVPPWSTVHGVSCCNAETWDVTSKTNHLTLPHLSYKMCCPALKGHFSTRLIVKPSQSSIVIRLHYKQTMGRTFCSIPFCIHFHSLHAQVASGTDMPIDMAQSNTVGPANATHTNKILTMLTSQQAVTQREAVQS